MRCEARQGKANIYENLTLQGRPSGGGVGSACRRARRWAGCAGAESLQAARAGHRGHGLMRGCARPSGRLVLRRVALRSGRACSSAGGTQAPCGPVGYASPNGPQGACVPPCLLRSPAQPYARPAVAPAAPNGLRYPRMGSPPASCARPPSRARAPPSHQPPRMACATPALGRAPYALRHCGL